MSSTMNQISGTTHPIFEYPVPLSQIIGASSDIVEQDSTVSDQTANYCDYAVWTEALESGS